MPGIVAFDAVERQFQRLAHLFFQGVAKSFARLSWSIARNAAFAKSGKYASTWTSTPRRTVSTSAAGIRRMPARAHKGAASWLPEILSWSAMASVVTPAALAFSTICAGESAPSECVVCTCKSTYPIAALLFASLVPIVTHYAGKCTEKTDVERKKFWLSERPPLTERAQNAILFLTERRGHN